MSLIEYQPFAERTVDTQYKELLERILREGKKVQTTHGPKSLRVIGHQMRFDLSNGFPIITERDLVSAPKNSGRPSQFHQAVGEMCAIINGSRRQSEFESFGCYWWDKWTTAEECARYGLEPGDLGPASYGPAWRRFPTESGEPFDQIKHLLQQMREHPYLRRHILNPWIPQLLTEAGGRMPQAVVAPCHGWVTFDLVPESKELTLMHKQRSADVPVGFVFNLIHYATMAHMWAQVLGYRAVELVYWIENAHIYTEGPNGESQLTDVEEMLATTDEKFPTVHLDSSVKNLFDFRYSHFTASDYYPKLPRRRIWTPV